MPNEKLQLRRLCDIFRNVHCCKSIFENSDHNQITLLFCELLKTASSNHDLSIPAQTSTNASKCPVQISLTISDCVVAFFSITPPPPSQRGPLPFNHLTGFSDQKNWKYHRKRNRHLYYGKTQLALCGGLDARWCWGCKMEDHIVSICLKQDKYLWNFDHLRQVCRIAVVLIKWT